MVHSFPADASESDADKEEEELERFKNINLRKGKKQVRIQLPPTRKKRPLPGSQISVWSHRMVIAEA
jgi:hypothetical protein